MILERHESPNADIYCGTQSICRAVTSVYDQLSALQHVYSQADSNPGLPLLSLWIRRQVRLDAAPGETFLNSRTKLVDSGSWSALITLKWVTSS